MCFLYNKGMNRLYVPEAIDKYIRDLEYTVDEVGLSESNIYFFDDYVLKISSLSFDINSYMNTYNCLYNKIPMPKIIECEAENNKIYILQEKLHGKMLCDEEYMNNPKLLYKLASDAVKLLWNVNVDGLQLQNSFNTIMRLGKDNKNYEYLKCNKPDADLSLIHGDLCLPNIICDGDRIVGFVDLGLMGIGDKYQDLAVLYRSIKYNYEGVYGKAYDGYDDLALFSNLGINKDENKIEYYLLLDEVLG